MIQQEKNSQHSQQKFNLKNWYSNRYQIVIVQRNILLIFAIFLLIAMAASVVFVKFVVSSKSLEPYVIELDEKSGVPTVVDQLTTQTLTGNEAVKKYFINQFIEAAVGYDPRTYAGDAEKVRLLSAQNVYYDFRNRIKPKDLGLDSKIDIKIKSMYFPDSSTAQIRILQNTTSKTDNSSKDKVINMNFYFTNLTLSSEERLINPLGFQVTNMTVAEELYNY